jgi:hypothetical protein
VAAKLVVVGTIGVVYAALGMLIGLLAAAPVLVAEGAHVDVLDAQVGRVALGVLATTALFGLAGTAVGALVRNLAGALVGAIAWFVAAEGIIGSVLGWEVARWLPGQAAAAAAGAGGGDLLPMGAGAVLFAAHAAALVALGVWACTSRDVA